jgi:hypothetical protein
MPPPVACSISRRGQAKSSARPAGATFLNVIGKASMTVTGTSTATTTMPLYIDFYLLLDNSPSMGVGATPADVSKMVNNTSDQCAFACHDLNNNNNYYRSTPRSAPPSRTAASRSVKSEAQKAGELLSAMYKASHAPDFGPFVQPHTAVPRF